MTNKEIQKINKDALNHTIHTEHYHNKKVDLIIKQFSDKRAKEILKRKGDNKK